MQKKCQIVRRLDARLALAIAVTTSTAFDVAAQSPCPTVTQSTKLTANCTGPLEILADRVFLDMGGKTVSCPEDKFIIGIDISNRRSVRVENGEVVNCVRGVNIVGGGSHLIKKVTMRQTTAPVENRVSYGAFVQGSSENTLESIVAENNSVGVDLTVGSFDNTLKGVKLNKNSLDGLQLDNDATDNVIRDSALSGNGRYGVFYGLRAARNVVIKSRVEENGWAGLIPDSANVIQKSTVRGNGSSVEGGFFRGGIVLFGSNNIINDNDARENFALGIGAGFSVNNPDAVANSIRKNKAKGTKYSSFAVGGMAYDLADLPPGVCTENFWKDNSGAALYDRCEQGGGDAPDYRATGAGKVAGIAFQFNVRRKEAGAASGPVKVDRLPVSGGFVKVEGQASCLITRTTKTGDQEAILGMIIGKTSDPSLAPVNQTLHIFVTDSAAEDAEGMPLDRVGFASINSFGPGDCFFTLEPAPLKDLKDLKDIISKGKVLIVDNK